MSGQDEGRSLRRVEQYTRSARLMNEMASAQGIDLQQGIASDEIHVGTLICAVTRCADCDGQDKCQLWLASQAGHTPVSTPDYCRNSELLARLKPAANENEEKG